jgi:dTDP-4-dehydrorhamnose 3,5-epimerase
VSFRRLPTELEEVALIEPTVHGDDRGFLVETFREDALRELGIDLGFVQDNHSRSRGPVLRGIHLQRGQAKLVRCPVGRVWDVAVDLRPGSPTYKRWEAHELDGERHRQLLIPAGFGHGFCLLSDGDDPELGIEWPISDPILSERDRSAPRLAEVAERLAV